MSSEPQAVYQPLSHLESSSPALLEVKISSTDIVIKGPIPSVLFRTLVPSQPGAASLLLCDCYTIDDATFIQSTSALTRLTRVRLGSNGDPITSLTASSVRHIVILCPLLTGLEIGVPQLTDISASAIAENCLNLREFSVYQHKDSLSTPSPRLWDRLFGTRSFSQNLTKLNIECGLDERSFTMLGILCPNLEEFNVRWLSIAEEDSVDRFAAFCPKLRILSLLFAAGSTQKFTDRSFVRLLDQAPSLTTLELANCDELTDVRARGRSIHPTLTVVLSNCPKVIDQHSNPINETAPPHLTLLPTIAFPSAALADSHAPLFRMASSDLDNPFDSVVPVLGDHELDAIQLPKVFDVWNPC